MLVTTVEVNVKDAELMRFMTEWMWVKNGKMEKLKVPPEFMAWSLGWNNFPR